MSGKLFIVGVGPGAPDLVTVKVVQVLKSVRNVFVPISQKGRESLAYEIIRQHIPKGTAVTELLFPMLRDRGMVEKHYIENYKKIESVLSQGNDAVLVTLGDPSTYSTSWPVFTLMQERAPDISVEVIPGVTSYSHGAARAEVPLAEGNEVLSIVSAYDSMERIESVIDTSDTVVFLKTHKDRQKLLEIIERRGLLSKCVYVKRCGLEGEEIIDDLQNLPADVDYLSMIILKKQK
jgi:precorrin-2/cobalt-factor-2 C20-methyltransferase